MKDAMSSAPRCEYPQTIRKGGSPFVVACGHCHFCRRGFVRRRQAQILSEFANPVNPNDIPALSRVHWFTLTYSEKHLTYVKPVPHPLGFVLDPDTDRLTPYLGPWPKGWSSLIAVWDGVPYWRKDHSHNKPRSELVVHDLQRKITPAELAELHREVLYSRWGWTPTQINEWVSGTYKPLPTLVYADGQKFLKRVRFKASQAGLGHLRYLLAGEYGDLNARPHFHLTLWGLPLESIDLVYDAWQSQGQKGDVNFGLINPSREAAHLPNVKPATVATPDAGRYQLKDMAKGSRHFQVSPELIALARPKAVGSARPPLGEITMHRWISTRIRAQFQRGLDDPLEPCFPDHLHQAVWAVRMVYGQFRLNGEQYPTPLRWKRKVREVIERLPGGKAAWTSATKMREDQHVEVSKLLTTPESEGGLQGEFVNFTQSIRHRANELRDAHARKIQEKRDRYESRTLSA